MQTAKQSIKKLMYKLKEAKDQNLIEEFINYNTCEINSYIVVTFNRGTNDDTKYRLAKHIKDFYEDIVAAHFSVTKDRLYVEYDDWEILPRHVAF